MSPSSIMVNSGSALSLESYYSLPGSLEGSYVHLPEVSFLLDLFVFVMGVNLDGCQENGWGMDQGQDIPVSQLGPEIRRLRTDVDFLHGIITTVQREDPATLHENMLVRIAHLEAQLDHFVNEHWIPLQVLLGESLHSIASLLEVAFVCLIPDPQGVVVPSSRCVKQLAVVKTQLGGYSWGLQSPLSESGSGDSSPIPSLESDSSPTDNARVTPYHSSYSASTGLGWPGVEVSLSAPHPNLQAFGSEEGSEVSADGCVEEGREVT
jgi:hypothetical protein